MENPAGESSDGTLRLDFDRRLKLEFHGSRLTSDAGLLAYRELDDALGLSAMAGDVLADARTARDGRHALDGWLRHDPAMRWIVAFKAAQGSAASPSQMARFGTMWLAAEKNLAAPFDLSDRWIDRAQARRSTGSIALDIDSFECKPHP
jgi:hypothetical protein